MHDDASRCYMCAAPATSREHVPPKCIFPEQKDIPGKNYRANLITVPSCEQHNSVKSRDDEFLMVSLAGLIGNNSIGYHHKFGKVNRAIRRSAGRLLDAAFIKRDHFRLRLQNNAFLEVIRGTPDYARLDGALQRIARGLFYHEFRCSFDGLVSVVFGYAEYAAGNSQTIVDLVRHRMALDLRTKPLRGSNQEVFYYQFTDAEHDGKRCLRMCFYGGLTIYCAFQPSGSQAFDLAAALINGGVHTVVDLDGETYSFNGG